MQGTADHRSQTQMVAGGGTTHPEGPKGCIMVIASRLQQLSCQLICQLMLPLMHPSTALTTDGSTQQQQTVTTLGPYPVEHALKPCCDTVIWPRMLHFLHTCITHVGRRPPLQTLRYTWYHCHPLRPHCRCCGCQQSHTCAARQHSSHCCLRLSMQCDGA
jgi:hypothetical protein